MNLGRYRGPDYMFIEAELQANPPFRCNVMANLSPSTDFGGRLVCDASS